MNGILVGIDRSEHSEQALEWAASEAAMRKVPLTVLTVHQVAAGYTGNAVYYASDRELTRRAQKVAQEQTDHLLEKRSEWLQPPSVTVRAVAGLPADSLLSAASGADMIVLGSRGTGGFRKLLGGSVAQKVTRRAHVPVVIIPSGEMRRR
jgi:nucleotide-binding universal stress UspA family protein